MNTKKETCPNCGAIINSYTNCGAIINSYKILNMYGVVCGCRACAKDIDAWGC